MIKLEKVKEYYNVTFLERFNIAGMTIGNRIFYARAEPFVSERLRKHEYKHVLQYREFSPFGILPLGILLYGIRSLTSFLTGIICYRNIEKAYLNIPMEIEARKYSKYPFV